MNILSEEIPFLVGNTSCFSIRNHVFNFIYWVRWVNSSCSWQKSWTDQKKKQIQSTVYKLIQEVSLNKDEKNELTKFVMNQ